MASKAYDLSKIVHLVTREKPPAIIIIDTNVIMKQPEFLRWETSLKDPVFILSDVIPLELQRHRDKDKKGQNKETLEAAVKASRSLQELCGKGAITGGIRQTGIGWFISVPSPKDSAIGPLLEELGSINKVFGPSDTKLLLITRELNETVTNIPSILLTGDVGLFNIGASNGVPVSRFDGFPVPQLEELVTRYRTLPKLDWDSVLAEVESQTEQESLDVELELVSSRRLSDSWIWGANDGLPLGNSVGYETMEARGLGLIVNHHTGEQRRFSWLLLYPGLDMDIFINMKPESEPAETNDSHDISTEIDHNFEQEAIWFEFGQGTLRISKPIISILEKKLLKCAEPLAYRDDMPTLISPSQVMTSFLLSEIAKETWTLAELIDDDDKFLEAFNHAVDTARRSGNLIQFTADWMDSERSKGRQAHLFEAIDSCWSVGQTVKFKVLPDANIDIEEGQEPE